MAKWYAISVDLPLLGKELTEQAARPRTYVVRVAYAVLLFAVSALLFWEVLRWGYGSQGGFYWQQVLGSGKRLFEGVVYIQFAGIFIFLPAMMSGVIAEEKEKASLGLLFLTDIGPTALLLQKYLGRLIPMLTFLLLSLPLMAVAYAFGGITFDSVFSGTYMLLLTCLQVGAFALLCSALSHTTAGALVRAYLGCTVFYFLPLLLAGASRAFMNRGTYLDEQLFLCHFPPVVMDKYGGNAFDLLVHSWPIVISVLVFLAAARYFLVSRAFVTPGNWVVALFKRLDTVFKRWNDRLGGVTLWRLRDTLPEEEPVAWRDMQKRALGKAHHLARLCLLIEIPAVVIGLVALNCSDPDVPLVIMTFVTWVLAALVLTVQGTNAIAAERTQQTLEVLLTTPLSGVDIVRQKMRALLRLCVVFAIPLLSLVVMNFWWRLGKWDASYGQGGSAWEYLAAALLAIVIYLPMLAWLSVLVGLRVRTRSRATLLALGGLVGWCVIPVAGTIVLMESRILPSNETLCASLMLLGPASAVVMTEVHVWDRVFHGASEIAIAANFLCYGLLLYLARRWCLRHADRWLRQG